MPKNKQNALSATTEKFTANMPHTAVWLVYIDGLEIPVNSINVQFGVWQIPTAQITLPPHVMLQRLGFEDRILVEVFYLDEFYNPNSPQFCFMGEYEIIEWGYTNTSLGRSINFSMRSTLQIFEQLKFYYMSSVDDIVEANTPTTGTSSETVTTYTVSYPLSLFLNGLVPTAAPDSDDVMANPLNIIKSPSEFIWNIFKALDGEVDATPDNPNATSNGTMPRSSCSVPGRNFFGRWLRKTDFKRRWTALYGFDDGSQSNMDTGVFPLLEAVTGTDVIKALADQIGVSVGHAGTAWELLQKILGVMLMEIGTTPAPPIASLNKKTKLYNGEFVSRDLPSVNAEASILAHYVKPQCFFAVPPRCNIIFPSMIESYSFSENFMNQPTRVYMGEEFMSKLMTAKDGGNIDQISKECFSTGYPRVVKEWMKAYITSPGANTKNFLIYPEELHRGPVAHHVGVPPWTYMLEKYYKAMHTPVAGEAVGGNYVATPTASTYKGGGGPVAQLLLTKYKDWALKYLNLLGHPELLYLMLATFNTESSGNPLEASTQSTAKGVGQIVVNTFNTAIGNLKKKHILTDADIAESQRQNAGVAPVFCPEINIAAACQTMVANVYTSLNYKAADITLAAAFTDPENDIPATPTPTIIAIYSYAEGIGSAKNLKQMVETNTYVDGKAAKKNLYRVSGKPDSGVKKDFTKTNGTPMEYWRRRCEKIYKGWKRLATLDGAATTIAIGTAASAPQAVDNWDATVQAPPSTVAQSFNAWITPAEANLEVEKQVIEATVLAKNKADQAAFAEAATNAGEVDHILGGIFDLYAKYEYFRARYEVRTASLQLAFDPYLVPGFPAVIFDARDSKLDNFGYVQSVSHSWSAEAPTISTSVSLGYLRSFPEFLNVYKQRDMDLDLDDYQKDSSDGYLAAPREPIEEVASVMQTLTETEEFYGALLYPTSRSKNISSLFNWEEMLDLRKVSGELIAPTALDSWVWEEGMYVDPKPEFLKLFLNYDDAMRYVARPVTTLKEFVELKNGKQLNDLKGADAEEAYDTSEEIHTGKARASAGAARYYQRIFRLRQGPGNIVDPMTISYITGVNTEVIDDPTGAPLLAEWKRIDRVVMDNAMQIPQTRRNWDKVLKNYRDFVRSKRFGV